MLHDSSSDKLDPPPLWEEDPPNTPEDLIRSIAGEVWHRTREPACEVSMAEATLAGLRARGSWLTIDRLNSESYSHGMERAEQAALIGFFLAPIIESRDSAMSVEDICTAALRLAGIVPMSPEVRAECHARWAAASEECRKLASGRKSPSTEGEPS